MEYSVWEPYYLKIAEDFGYSPETDAMAGVVLAGLLAERSPVGPSELRQMMKGNDVRIYGPAKPNMDEFGGVKVAADSAVHMLLSGGIMPDIIVTDLDGDVQDTMRASSMGSVVLVHAHGDNAERIRRYVPLLRGRTGGTVQTEPFPPLMNFGGFTDGDRAVFLADSMGAKRIELTGFDFEKPVIKDGMTEKMLKIKERKLRWARRLISLFDVEMV